jgi:hypothetical protein
MIDAVIGFGGGAAAELARWFGIRDQLHTGMPAWSRCWAYWIVTFLMCVCGGGLVYVYSLYDIKVQGILALNVGASAPLVVASLARSIEGGLPRIN